MSEEIASRAEPTTQLEDEGYLEGFKRIAGLDEVGRGPWAGPVVAAAVIFPRGLIHSEIRDSKLLAARRREELSVWIKERAVAWGLGIVGPEEIDRINILQATLSAMGAAVKQLKPSPDLLLIDGTHVVPLGYLEAAGNRQQAVVGATGRWPLQSLPAQRAIKKGDRICHAIAAASIIAKVARDEMMAEYDKQYPGYGFAQHKGYGAPAHEEALRRLGPSPIHRRSFRPVREWEKAAVSKEAVSDQPTLTLARSVRERVG
ncbi:MAG: ribonuclease HII [Deltaproteobacteria bacterium RIFCSPLOWO2_12_FULL_60_19]|nr:MAG: ribonuclease HII [Deltaproteobacteria bacterium RIFCSPLOWO2_12_FULL_60_19]